MSELTDRDIMELTQIRMLLEELIEEQRDVVVAPPDLSAIALALTSLPQSPSAEQIAEAITSRIRFPDPVDLEPTIRKLTEAVTKIGGSRSDVPHMAFGNGVTVRNKVSDPVPVEIQGGGVVEMLTVAEISNDTGNPIPVSSTTLATQATLAELLAVARPTETITASGTALAGAALTVTLPAVAGKTNYITRFMLTSSISLSPISIDVTLTGAIGGTLNYRFVENTSQGSKLDPFWTPALPASAANTAISVVMPAVTGGATISLNVVGFRL